MENLSGRWASGTGPRILSIGDYPFELRLHALEQMDSFEKPGSDIMSKEPEDLCIHLSRKYSKSLFETALSFKNLLVKDFKQSHPEELAAMTIQRIYKGYRTRRRLADAAIVAEELWGQVVESLDGSSDSFFNLKKLETAFSGWDRARIRAAKVVKGKYKNEKAEKLALQHWLEAIDPRHRYGPNLHIYYDLWFKSKSTQPFFYWLDIGDGKDYDHETCPRSKLQHQCIIYLGPHERESYEVVFVYGKLFYRQSGLLLETTEGSTWIFVLSTSRNLYVGQKQEGLFHHSSFLSGRATLAAGRLVAHGGVIEVIWPYCDDYIRTDEHYMKFLSFLEERHVDLINAKVRMTFRTLLNCTSKLM